MLLSTTTALIMLAQSPAQDVNVAYASLKAGDDQRAISEIESGSSSEKEDPASLINLGVAYARAGDEVRARQYFEAALASPERYSLETANGEWVDSRRLAAKALRKLDRGEFRSAVMLTQR